MKRHRPDHLTNQIDMRAWDKTEHPWKRYLTFAFLGFMAPIVIFGIDGITKEIANRINKPPKATEIKYIVPQPTITPTTTPEPTKIPLKEQTRAGSGKWQGYVSHYSRSGCLGCSATLTMANGETLDDDRATIAFNWLPMNTRVRITNTDNGKSIEAIVTDTGGFNRLNRIADLVPAVANYLETKTDRSLVIIEQL